MVFGYDSAHYVGTITPNHSDKATKICPGSAAKRNTVPGTAPRHWMGSLTCSLHHSRASTSDGSAEHSLAELAWVALHYAAGSVPHLDNIAAVMLEHAQFPPRIDQTNTPWLSSHRRRYPLRVSGSERGFVFPFPLVYPLYRNRCGLV
jgi:hypothetical protein